MKEKYEVKVGPAGLRLWALLQRNRGFPPRAEKSLKATGECREVYAVCFNSAVQGVLTSDRYVSREDREKGARLLKDPLPSLRDPSRILLSSYC